MAFGCCCLLENSNVVFMGIPILRGLLNSFSACRWLMRDSKPAPIYDVHIIARATNQLAFTKDSVLEFMTRNVNSLDSAGHTLRKPY